MVETQVGINIMEQLLTATATPIPFDAVHARIAIGDGGGIVPVVSAGDAALTATPATTSNTVFMPMNTSFPQVQFISNVWVMVWQGTATSAQGNFTWREWAIDNGNSGGPAQLFNHKGVLLGTKTAGTTWTFQASVTQT